MSRPFTSLQLRNGDKGIVMVETSKFRGYS